MPPPGANRIPLQFAATSSSTTISGFADFPILFLKIPLILLVGNNFAYGLGYAFAQGDSPTVQAGQKTCAHSPSACHSCPPSQIGKAPRNRVQGTACPLAGPAYQVRIAYVNRIAGKIPRLPNPAAASWRCLGVLALPLLGLARLGARRRGR